MVFGMHIHPEIIKHRGRAFAGLCVRQCVNPSNIPADKDKSKLFQVIPRNHGSFFSREKKKRYREGCSRCGEGVTGNVSFGL
jgi:hypothetical protein